MCSLATIPLALAPCMLPLATRFSHSTSASRSGSCSQGLPMVFEVAHPALGELAAAGGDEVGRLICGVIDRRPRAGDHHRQAAGHRLDDRRCEALAAERVHQAIAGGIQASQLRLRAGCGRYTRPDTRGLRVPAYVCLGGRLAGGVGQPVGSDRVCSAGSPSRWGQTEFQVNLKRGLTPWPSSFPSPQELLRPASLRGETLLL